MSASVREANLHVGGSSGRIVHVTDIQGNTRLPRAQLLDRLRAQQGLAYVPELELVRDVLYLMQGISGTHVRLHHAWQLPSDNGSHEACTHMRLDFDEHAGMISPPTRDLIHRLAELGQLFERVQAFVDSHESQPVATHLTAQSLCHFLTSELQAHNALLTDLDAQWHAQAEGEKLSPPLTLQRLAQVTSEPMMRMRLMSTIVESCRHAHGGALVSTIHTYTLTGHPFIRRCTATMLDHVSRPFFHTLSRWIYDGELDDPFHEFFVARAPPSQTRKPPLVDDLVVPTELGTDAADVWHNRFVLQLQMLPSFLSEHFARKIFSTGKSLHFLRDCCSSGHGHAEYDDTAQPSVALDPEQARLRTLGYGSAHRRELRYSDMAGLEHAIDAEFALASGHLCMRMLSTFRLLDHLRALKSYLLLTQGDFADALLETLGPSLARPASTLYQHNLSAALETAIRASNAQFDDPEILRRLDARSLEFGPGDTGWDTFTLEYRVDSPVNAVLDASAMAGYQLLFNYLWHTNRVAARITAAWSQLLSVQKAVLRSRHRKLVDRALMRQLRATLGHVCEMVHFVRHLQSFIELEGISYAWQRLEHDLTVTKPSDLDHLVDIHRTYLHMLISTTLMRGRRSASDHLASDVRAQLHGILAYADATDELGMYVTSELARLAGGVDPLSSAARTHAHVSQRLVDEHTQFQHRLQSMLAALERHPTLTVRDLARRWNFNNVYYRRERTTVSTSHATTTTTSALAR